jgi:FAD/FMN-containing dehydrogenase
MPASSPCPFCSRRPGVHGHDCVNQPWSCQIYPMNKSLGAGKTPDWPALQRAIAGDVVLADSPDFVRTWKPLNARFARVRPQAVVLSQTPDDVRETIHAARLWGLATAIRSGGHSFAGESSSRGVVIDVSPMDGVSFRNGQVVVGAGTRLGDLYGQLSRHARVIPAGSCPTVGIAGLALGGGLGFLGRMYGLTSDHLIAAQIVLADGRIITCDGQHHGELLWALRGGGAGNFGVVTQLRFRSRPAPSMTIFRLFFGYEQAAAAIREWQGWAPAAPDELAASLVLASTGKLDRRPSVEVFGGMVGTQADAEILLGAFVDRVGSDPASTVIRSLSFVDAIRYLGSVDRSDGDPMEAPKGGDTKAADWDFAKSEFFRRPLPADAIAALLDRYARDRARGQYRELDFSPWGGAYSRALSGATAFVHRDHLFMLKHAVGLPSDASVAARHAAHRWVTRSWAAVHRWGSGGVFRNFPDPDLPSPAAAYYAGNLERLRQVKARYDPDQFFRSELTSP